MSDKAEPIVDFIKKFWYIALVGAFFIFAAALFIVYGEDSYIAIHDNMDLFIPQFQMMKNDGTFFTLEAETDFLDGISRNVLPSEFSLYTMLYIFLPSYAAYVTGYFLKIAIAVLGAGLLIYDILIHEGLDAHVKHNVYYVHAVKRDYSVTIAVAVLVSFTYGILNLFPAFGIPFASIPLIIYYLRRVYVEPSAWYFTLIFFYPFLSYFSYHGIFIMGYLVIGIVVMWLKDHEFPWTLLLAEILLVVGSVICEYRLFITMLFSDDVTIRSTMVEADLNVLQILGEIGSVLLKGMMHADDAHMYVVLPVCVIYFVYRIIQYFKEDNPGGILHDYFYLCILIILINSVICGLYDCELVRDIVAFMVPPLTGWQFNRTVFFNPFLWYAAFFIVCYRICTWSKQDSIDEVRGIIVRLLTYVMILASIAVVLMQPALPFGETARYNDLYFTAYGKYYQSLHNGTSVDTMSYREFFDEELFEQIKADIHYEEGEKAVAYLMYPAQLEYNDISTLDGYLGFYPQAYKDEWRQVIAPALDRQPASAAYFDNSGIRCYLYSGDYAAVPMYTKSLGGVTADNLYINTEALYDLGCKYIFSRVDITNAKEMNMTSIGVYEGDAYMVYIYELGKPVEN